MAKQYTNRIKQAERFQMHRDGYTSRKAWLKAKKKVRVERLRAKQRRASR